MAWLNAAKDVFSEAGVFIILSLVIVFDAYLRGNLEL